MNRYHYKKPRTFNWVTIFLILAVAGGAYSAWKFVPVYYQRSQVDGVLRDMASQAVSISSEGEEARTSESKRILSSGTDRMRALGVDDPDLVVDFSPDYTSIHADYTVVVHHLFVKRTTTLTFHRAVSIPK